MNLGAKDTDDFGREEQYMMFKINTDEKTTKLNDDKSLGGVVVSQARTGTGVEGAQLIWDKNDDADSVIKYGQNAVNKEKWFTQKGMTRLDKVIVLPMPLEHSVRTKLSYDNAYDPSNLTKVGDFLNTPGGGVISDVASLGKNKAISWLMNKISSGSTSERDLQAEERLARNPKKEVMFNGFDFRNFSFSWVFAPKNEKESDMVKSIIETFRYYSLPEITAGKLFYIFPSEFEISFMQGQKDNPNIPKIATSVLQSISVNYTPSSVWSTLPNGAPLSLSITLDFLELELIDRSRIYNPNSIITSGY